MITVLTAFIVDFIIGDPHTKLHPVALIGRWISLLERLFYNEKSTKWEHFILGGLTVVITLLFVYNITLVLVLALEFLPNEHWSYIIQGVLLSFMICPRSLAKAGREVYRYLVRHHLRIAQLKVGKIVGRDTDHLDSPEVTRATVETIAENTVDGIVSPLFFFAIGSVKGFGLTLALGIACDVVTMFCFKAPALRLLALGTIERHPVFWGVDQDLAEAKRRQDAQAKKGGVRNA